MGKQRYYCPCCHKTFVWQRRDVTQHNEQYWFKLWVTESYSVRQLTKLSGHSKSTLERIKNYWLNKIPEDHLDLSQYKYLLFDGTYFHKQGCLILLMDAPTQKVIMNAYVATESYYTVRPLLAQLKALGLRPKALIMDGHRMVMRAIREIWTTVIIQRCLYHIQREGLRWLRTYPKTEAGKELRFLLRSLSGIKSIEKRDQFINQYTTWITEYKQFVRSLPGSTVAYKDLKKTMGLISNAIPNMFHFLNDPKIHPTTNLLESFFSRLKADFRRHRGLSESHKQSYLRWYCYFKGHQKTNTF